MLNWIGDYFNILMILSFAAVAGWSIWRKNSRESKAKKYLEKAMKTGAGEPTSLHPEIDAAKCAGCGVCTRVCPEGDILQMINHKAVLVAPTKCVGHGECEKACPFGAIDLVFGTKTRGLDIPRLTTNYETNVPGLYIAGELGGMGLIRNAVKQGVMAGAHGIKSLGNEKTDTDFLIVGAGPAGLSVALSAIASKKSYLLIEQSSFGGTVYNFPRQKVVMSHPADLPVVGKMQFSGNKVSKEDLLKYWNDVRSQTGLKVRENTKFDSLEKQGSIFRVKTSAGEFTAKKVFLCMGVRGSPRKLGLPNEDLPKVTYNLLDPEQYRQKHVAVVGGGNAGVEAAQYLARQSLANKVTLLVRGAGFDRCNEENKNIVLELQKKGFVDIWYNSSVAKIDKEKIVVQREGDEVPLKNDFLFVFAGAELPHKFLMSLGVQIDKKFGEKLKRDVS